MPQVAKNQELVPAADLPYFIAATAAGIRQQLRDAGIPTSGLKYDLYLRLRANGLSLYNDIRDADSSESDSSEDEDSEAGSPGPVSPPLGRTGRKRAREEDEEDIEQPAAKRVSLVDVPAEIEKRVINNLDAAGIFNLAAAVPDQFLSDDKIDAFRVEAERRKQPEDRDGRSLLEWVLQRVGSEYNFRTDHQGLIQRVVDTYMASYAERSEEARVEQIMWYYRNASPLFYAVRQGLPDMVYLLVLTGENTNEMVDGATPLDEATLLVTPSISDVDRLSVIFALLAGGAITTMTNPGRLEADEDNVMNRVGSTSDAAAERLRQIRPGAAAVTADPADWPVIENPRGLTVRQFLGDERSPLLDRATMALYLIGAQVLVYPNFQW
ncbi:hypothetical protein Daus18300_001869 [Diaporthe australafricana]|uniref:SAP domain-containing protein n=1 Tax=Diaporthe australafricana TaxID=127596 RepID=A0ABR3XUP7_9PEZI